MIGDTYKIKYSDYLTSGRYILIEATDRVSRPGINTTNVNHPRATITDAEIAQAPSATRPALIAARDAQTIDMTFYGYRASGYGAQLWNNLFNLLENYAQPSATTNTVPLYSQQTTLGQIWVNTSTTPTAYWYGRTNTFYKLGASINIATDSSQVLPGELWFDPTSYTFKFYSSGWNDINCIPYVSQTEYNQLVDDINILTTSGLPKLTGTTRPTPANWAAAVAVLRLLGASYGVSVPAGEPITTVIAGNFTSCNHNSYGISAIRSVFSQIRTAVRELTNTQFPPSVVPLAGFIASPTLVKTTETVTFTDATLNTGGYKLVNGVPVPDVARYSWDFGDPASGALNTSTIAGNVTHVYDTLGTYTVRLTVTNSKGSTSSQVYVQAVTKPVASFTVDNADRVSSSTTPFVVQFTDTSTNGPTSWLWDFGDGTTSSLQNPLHEYTTQGIFDVKLTASNMAGSGFATGAVNDVTIGSVPDSRFSAPSTTSTTAPFTVAFRDESSNLPQDWIDINGEPHNGWSWNFGDGTTSNLQHPSHTYTLWGRYTVSLQSANPVGPDTSPKVIDNFIQIGVVPTADFTTSSLIGSNPVSVSFTNTTTNAPDGNTGPPTWLWNFGDGYTSTDRNPTHSFPWGTYSVSLTATNSFGTSTATTHQLVVQPPTPVANFSFTPASGQAPLAIQFTDLSTNGPTSWLWDFGDGTTSTTQNPSHTFTGGGYFTVTLTATNSAGTNSLSQTTGYLLPPSGNITYLTGTSAFVVPTGITSLSIAATGGGGSGGASWCCDTSCGGGGGGGGGGGAWAKGTIAVIPGSTLTISVGAAGAQAAGASWGGGAGGVTTISGGGTGVYIQLGGGGGGGGGTNFSYPEWLVAYNQGIGGPGGDGGTVAAITGFAGEYGPGAAGGQGNVYTDYATIAYGGCVDGNPGGSTKWATGGAGGANGGYAGGGGGGGASYGFGGNGGAGNSNPTNPGSGFFGGGGGGTGDERGANPSTGGTGQVVLSWSSANTALSGQLSINPTSYPRAFIPGMYPAPATPPEQGGR